MNGAPGTRRRRFVGLSTSFVAISRTADPSTMLPLVAPLRMTMRCGVREAFVWMAFVRGGHLCGGILCRCVRNTGILRSAQNDGSGREGWFGRADDGSWLPCRCRFVVAVRLQLRDDVSVVPVKVSARPAGSSGQRLRGRGGCLPLRGSAQRSPCRSRRRTGWGF